MAPRPGAPPATQNAAHDIEAMLHASAEEWNRGELDAFLEDYADDATFVSGSGFIRGLEEIRRRYVDGYWSTGMPEDGLRFRMLDVRAMDGGAAVAVGRYILYDRSSGEMTATGLFSLTLRWTLDGWRIVHDHSSADEPAG